MGPNQLRSWVLLFAPTTLFFSGTARADEPEVPRDFPRIVLETGRAPVQPAEPDVVRFQVHGEYQARYQAMASLRLTPTSSAINTRPGLREDTLGQTNFGHHWLRVTPRLQVKTGLEVVGQLDVLTGLVIGDRAHDTHADHTPRDDYNGFSNIQPRWLYATINTEVGVVRVGQQPSHWGMGILANDGDHPSVFGDYRYGAIVERILFATRPLGKESAWNVALAGDLVYRDNTARLTRGDHAYQGVVATWLERGQNQIGIYGVYRNQTRERVSGGEFFPYDDKIEVGVIDSSARFATPVAGEDAYLFGAAEAAFIFGSTNAVRTQAQALEGRHVTVRAYGGAVQLGVAHTAHESDDRAAPANGSAAPTAQKARPPMQFGDIVAQVEVGYASGDADPYDDVQKRFTFEPNHRIGLLLFDEVMRFQTARAATAAQDPLLANASRPTPGSDLLPSNGGVFGAQYINPTVIVRPVRRLDLKGGMVVAQATADVVDPYRLALQGSYVNYRGGSAKRRDLGMELDAGFEWRIPLDYEMTLNLGAQGGLLFPGGALANALGERMKTPWITIARAGLQF